MTKCRRRRLHLSNIYAFKGRKSNFQEDHSHIGGPGFSRVVYCNEPNSPAAERRNYVGNYVRSTKYTLASFIPKSLFEQFRRVANFYFLVTGVLSLTALSPYSPISALLPLTFVIAASMVKEAIEDWGRRKQDIEMNNRKVKVHDGNGIFRREGWRNLKVGDIVRVEKDEFFPADLLLLSSSYEDSICYVETMNLDGETNLKVKQGLEATSSALHEDSDFKELKAVVKCEDPNADLYTFVGTLHFEEQRLPLSITQLLLRDSKLRNTEYIYGVVVFTGHDTKVIQNSTDPPSKRSRIERKMDKIIYLMFGVVFLMSFIGSIVFGIETREDRVRNGGRTERWYLRPDNADIFFDPDRAPMAAVYHFFTAVMLYSYFIPISLYVSIEIVKVLQSLFINNDILMYYEENDKPAHARTSNLNEELGMVDTILSDKTGTLTCNSMEFIKCSIAGTAYGRGITEVERSMAMRSNGSSLVGDDLDVVVDQSGPKIKGFNFQDERVMKGNWVKQRDAAVLQKFFRLLAVCHTAIPETDEATGSVSYEAESPDEAAFVVAAREFGFEFFSRTQNGISFRELDLASGKTVERVYRLLNVLEFNSARKRMSVIVRDEDGRLLLLSKGADNVMFERLAKNGRKFEEKTREHVNEYADAGLRTLILAYREVDENEYIEFSKNFNEAKNSVTADRESLIDEITEQMERDLILLGATAVEDKLQNGVPDCIDKLAQAGIKIWVLTGDKMETAINIGFACSLLRQEMKQIIINLETPHIKALEKAGEKDAIEHASRESVVNQMEEGKALLTASSSASSHEAFALITSEITLQLAQLRRTLHYIRNGTSENEESVELRQKYALKPSDLRHKNALRMLEKSLSRELELEKKLMEFQQNEEQLKLKLHYTEEVSSRMEEASEFIWGRFLEADNSSEVLTGISKELVGRLQILQFSLNGSAQRESELKSKLEDCTVQLEAKDLLVQKLEGTISENSEIVSEVLTLREYVKSAEQKLKNTDLELKSVNASKQEILVHLAEMENANESVKENLFEAESRAESGEAKIKELDAANLELTEELNFLKDADDKKTKKVNSLEKQVRELEVQVQNSKVSSEANQEQQNMLYSAIWDMETLIEDLKSKASKAESRTETVEEQCIVLSTTNSELNKDVSFLRQKAKSLEAMLDLANNEKERYAQEITTRNKVLMDMMLQLSSERERIQEQLYSLAKENKILRVNQCSNTYQRNGSYAGDKELSFHADGHEIEALAESLQAGG